MLHQDTAVGALKVYSAVDHAFTAETERLLTMFAGPAAALLAHVQTKDLPVQLSASIQRVMGRRDTINIGKGVLMAVHGLDEGAATKHMIKMAQAERSTLLEAAERIIANAPPQSGRTL